MPLTLPSEPVAAPLRASPAISLPALRIEARTLVIPPFCLQRLSQRFHQADELRIDLGGLVPDLYRVLAVQNFWIEDASPDLNECLAAVFLARRTAEGGWEEPERWPVECRTLGLLGVIGFRDSEWMLVPPHDPEYLVAAL